MSEISKDELIKDLEDWIDTAISRLTNLKGAAARVVRGEEGELDIDPHTLSLLSMVIGQRESRLKRRRDVAELMGKLRKEGAIRREELNGRIKETSERRDNVEKLVDGHRKERLRYRKERLQREKEWGDAVDYIRDKRRKFREENQ